jgi:hypothetical protein
VHQQGSRLVVIPTPSLPKTEAYDEWLSEFLSNGPMPLEAVKDESARAQLRLGRDRNHYG